MNGEQQQIYHYLVVSDSQDKRLIPLESSTYSIGRDPNNSIPLKSRWVSRQHAILLRVTVPNSNNYLFRIIDGDLQGKRSTNGLRINGRSKVSHDLKHGDVIGFGKDIEARYYTTYTAIDPKILESGEISDLLNQIDEEEDNILEKTLITDHVESKEVYETSLIRLASFPELNPNPVIEISMKGKLTYLNPTAIQVFPEIQTLLLEHPLLAGILPVNKHHSEQKHFEREIYVKDRCFRQLVHYIYESDLVRSYVVDITDYKQAEAALRKSEAKNRALLDAIPDLMLHLNSSGIILDFKVPKGHPLQSSSANFVSQNIYQILPTPAAQQMIRYVRRTLQTNRTEVFEYESLVDGSILFYEARIVTITQDEALAIIRNITDRKNFEKQLLYDALHDALTGLPNRNLFMNRLSHAIELAKRRDDYLFAVLFIDLDRFKVINDSLGHIVGDQLLIAISRKLEACLRSGDTVARLGGDEFAILLEDINGIEAATALAERLQRELSIPFYLDHQEVFVTLSVGIALSTTGYHLPEELLRDADTAMYHAKSLGRARYELFDQQMHDRAVALLQLDNDLRRAVERQEFILYYQPIVSLITGHITGFEALIRWQHPQRGLVPPDEFITLAEETGLIIAIGDWLLREACTQAQRWQQQFPKASPLTISVNLASQQFSQPQLVEKVGKILAETGMAPGTLNLEITEGTIMENIQLSKDIFVALKRLNLQLCIDDFGTGYSSLSYLHRFPIDILKVDRSFVNTINPHTDSHGATGIEITQTIIMLAHNLELSVVAEGIETIEQLQYLRERNCEYGQGYLFSHPLPSHEVEALLTANPTW